MSELDFELDGPVVEWRGPAPLYFVAIPEEESADVGQVVSVALGVGRGDGAA